MDHITLTNGPAVDVRLRRSARARRLSLRVSRLDGRVTLTLPKRASTREARGFIEEKESWIRGHLLDRPAEIVPTIGGWITLRGERLEIVAKPTRGVVREGGQLLVGGPAAQVPARLAAVFKQWARTDLAQASTHYATLLGVDYGRLTLRDTRSRWGSCSSEGNLMYSWRLVMAPPDVLQYVAAHEVAHRLEMNHSDRFWVRVAEIYPNYDAPREWLRQNGETLHQFRFRD